MVLGWSISALMMDIARSAAKFCPIQIATTPRIGRIADDQIGIQSSGNLIKSTKTSRFLRYQTAIISVSITVGNCDFVI
jgi:hypothetical protein